MVDSAAEELTCDIPEGRGLNGITQAILSISKSDAVPFGF
jgi:hypothetical protein